jgi:hypothetical protein
MLLELGHYNTKQRSMCDHMVFQFFRYGALVPEAAFFPLERINRGLKKETRSKPKNLRPCTDQIYRRISLETRFVLRD